MDPQNALVRFLFLGTTAPYYLRPKHKQPIIEDLQCIQQLIEGFEADIIVNLIKKVIIIVYNTYEFNWQYS